MQDNLLAATADDEAQGEVFNVAVSGRTTLNQLFEYLPVALAEQGVSYTQAKTYRDFRPGDVRNSQADICKAHQLLGYEPTHTIVEGSNKAMPWYVQYFRQQSTQQR